MPNRCQSLSTADKVGQFVAGKPRWGLGLVEYFQPPVALGVIHRKLRWSNFLKKQFQALICIRQPCF